MSGTVRVTREGRVATVLLDNPPLNILDLATIGALDAAFADLAGDSNLHLIVLRAAGEKGFSAGVSVYDHTPQRIGAMLAGFHGLVRRVMTFPAPTLAVVHGHCLGGAMELAVACDLVLAADDAHFGQPEVKLGCYPPLGAALYPGRLGTGRTLDLLLSGRIVHADEAERLGLVTWRTPRPDLGSRLEEIVGLITGGSAAVARLIKKAVAAGGRLPFDEALAEAERIYLEELASTEDMAEGIRAFLEKRPPRWQHR